MNTPYPGTQAVLRAVTLLQAFGPEPNLLTPQELSRRTGLNRSTVYRLLSALEQVGMVMSDGAGRYRLGPELVALGNLALRQIDLREVTLPHLRRLAQQSGETVDLEVLRGGMVLIIEEIAGDHLLTTSGNIGRTYPAQSASTGKILLANLPPEQLEVWLSGPFGNAIADMAAFRAELSRIREQGYATSYEELEVHLHAIGAVIYDHTGQAAAAISISGPAARLPRSEEQYFAALVRDTCAAISQQLGYREPRTKNQEPTANNYS